MVCYFQNNQKPIKNTVYNYIERIVNVEMVINTNLTAHKCPFLIGSTTEDKEKLDDLVDRIISDELAIYLSTDEISMLKSLTTTTPYIIDKLYQYKVNLENELLTFLGIDNNPIEKSQNISLDEINANNELINLYKDNYVKNMKDFFAKIGDIFGVKLTVISNINDSKSLHENDKENEDESNM